jgi:hypothetical protein
MTDTPDSDNDTEQRSDSQTANQPSTGAEFTATAKVDVDEDSLRESREQIEDELGDAVDSVLPHNEVADDAEQAPEYFRIDRRLTAAIDVFNTAGLVLADEFPTEPDVAMYKPKVLERWAEVLADVQGHVEVGVVPVVKRPENDDGESGSNLGLVARVPDSDVVAFAAPLTPSEEDEEAPAQSGDEA